MNRTKVVSLVTDFINMRCSELGFIPQTTDIPPHNKVFDNVSDQTVYIKLFGHNSDLINTVNARWGFIDPVNPTLTTFGPENLTLTPTERYLLLASVTQALDLDTSHDTLLKESEGMNSLDDLLTYCIVK